jgi:hypothetical protein
VVAQTMSYGVEKNLQRILFIPFAAVSSHIHKRYRCLTTAVSAQSKRCVSFLDGNLLGGVRLPVARFIFLLHYNAIIRNLVWATRTQHNEEKSVGKM